MELTWAPLKVEAAPEGSAYAEFWLYAPGAAAPQLALAGVVRHIGPVLHDLVRTAPRQRQATGNDPPAAAS